MKPKVLITERLDEECAAWLGERAEVVWVAHDDPAAMAEHLPGAQGMVVRTYTQVDAALLAQAPELKVIGRAGVGLDNFDLPACEAAGVRVVYTPDANTQAVVEYVTGLMIDHVRPKTPLPGGADDAVFHAMRKTEVGTQLDEMTLGILGFGRIGKRLGQVAHAIGMNLHVCDLLPEAEMRKAVDYPFTYCSHEELYAGSDVVSVHVDGRPENRQMMGASAFAAMREHVVFINAARGMLVDHDALAAWAEASPRASAFLDVHDPEPPSADSPLHGLGNVTLLPHLASRTGTALKNMSWVVRDVDAVLAGKEPSYPAF
ncbi:NAD(P)-dependent oxidoreductase [Algisphaera agarilytica]|uniref:D-3-phosphoglycerate dehydrogenase n=1 Tax=Algisphaera agarilytica TaxID=1385975 RepID=A0A7X0H8I7_9BACT|nr:NAD(P)-dependent oxidoreductase [Algisphaera agarilytica]MBB6430071.1 D-3-phosphoglycerate dehydrogenase [Algisphaera agarilytica]